MIGIVSKASGRIAIVAALFTFLVVPAVPGTADETSRGELVSLQVGPDSGQGILLRGRDARAQVFVTGEFAAAAGVDLTRSVEYRVEPAELAHVEEGGLVVPLADGVGKLVVTQDGKSAESVLTVSGFHEQVPINFKNQIVPIFTKLGCNGGGCHGKASGQNGFRLSLLGFYPEEDYEFLVKESRGRRLFPAAPGRSLLLTKAVGQVPHGGGKRMSVDSFEYRMLYRWIEQGMSYGSDDDPFVVAIRCVPEGRVMGQSADQQIAVIAEFSDGTTEDVTRMALYEPNDTEMAEVSEEALVKTLDLAGEVAIMARYQGQVSTFRATIPLGAEIAEMPPRKNLIDDAVFNKLSLLGIPPSPVCDDATFLRRVRVDLTGTLPTDAEVQSFMADADPDKRAKLIDVLLDSHEYADYFANKWNMVLRNKKQQAAELAGTYAFYRWIWSSLYENKPYDEFVREILTASGDPMTNPPVVWYREVDQVDEQVEDTAQLFLGLRIQCARCHHHPFEKWSQNDYYGMAAFFSRVGKKNVVGAPAQVRDRRVFHNEGDAVAKNPRSNQNLKPTGLGKEAYEISSGEDPRTYLADWMADAENPFFAPALVNRYWKHFFSRGVVEPEDDMRATNPPSNPELLSGLSKHFVESGFDLKELVRTICNSSTYQLSSLPNEHNLKDKQNFSRYYPKRLTAEVLYDGFHQVTGTTQSYGGLPAGTKAVQLPDPAVGPYFLKVFGQPQGDTACECERSQEANLAQSLHLLNSSEVQGKVANGSGRAATLAADEGRSHEDRVRELYRWVYSREPVEDELAVALEHIQKNTESVKLAYEDITWALINTKEFLFNH